MLNRRQLLGGMLAGLLAPLIPLPAQTKPKLYISPEAIEDIRSWGVDNLDEQTKREVLAYRIPFQKLPSTHILIGDTHLIPTKGKVVNGRLLPT